MTDEVPAGAITVGIDDSDPSFHALRWAVRQAELEQRPLCVLHSYDPRPVVYSSLGATFPGVDLTDALDKAAEEVLHRARQEAREQSPDVPVTLVWSTLDPREALAEAARSASLLVVASRGRGAMSHLLLGSTGSWISHHAPCPVVVVRGEAEAEDRRWIVVGSDGTSDSDAAIEFGFRQAELHGARLTVVRCLALEVGGLHRPHEGPVEEDVPERRALEESVAKASARHPDVRVECELRRGSASGHLTRVSEGASMVVLGSHPRHGVGAFGLGGIRRAVTEHAACSVAVVPGEPTSGD
ncbi:universal stress protein [Nocardioides sp. MAHUQ-72]|uniref:universal stress protein n=1 Tax=unclassified Nocardioides TaxID=2615069 RepID=UPI00361828DB